MLRTHKSDLEWSLILNADIPKKVFDRNFSRKSVSNINYLIHWTNAKIVVTSTWRNNFSVEELKVIFKNQGILGDVVDKTGVGLTRGEEIIEWLDSNEVEKYVVIDDQIKDIIIHIDENKAIHVNSQIGFEDQDLVDKAIDILL